MANAIRGDQFFRVCISTQTLKYQNRSTCTCFRKNRQDKATETLVTSPAGNEKINFKPTLVSKRTNCTRCSYSHKETCTVNEEIPEPYAASSIRFYETHEPESRNSSTAKPANLTPKEVMNTWMPGIDRPAASLFPPSDNYVDVSPKDFSLRKYCPELFSSNTEKMERMISKDLEEEQQLDECRDRKCPRGSCSSTRNQKNLKADPDWRSIVEARSVIRTPCPWGDEGVALAREREEVADEESNPKTHVPPKRDSKWFRWSCGKLKREKKKDEL